MGSAQRMMGALGRTFGEIKGTKNDTKGCWKGIFFSSNDWGGNRGQQSALGRMFKTLAKGECWATKDDRNNAKHIKKDKLGMINRTLGAS